MHVFIHFNGEWEPSSCKLVLISLSAFSIAKEEAVCLTTRSLFHRSLSAPAVYSAPGVNICDLWHCVIPFTTTYWDNSVVELQVGRTQNREDLWRTRESSPVNTLQNREMWGQPHGISHVGLAPKTFISSAYNNSEEYVLRKCLTTSNAQGCLEFLFVVWFCLELSFWE